ncbi:MAG: PAS domain S-box protein [Magnetovibrio sp.]|nr:PAS domain S-box protein [Magnetovibrio sp.]
MAEKKAIRPDGDDPGPADVTGDGQFRLLADSLNVGILVHRYFQPLYANEAFADLFGFSGRDEVLEFSGIDNLFTKESQDAFRRRHEARLRGEPAPSEYILQARRLDGAFIWVNNRPVRMDWEGEPAICTTLIDVTERVLAQEALKTSEDEYRRLFENAGEGLFRSIPEGRLVAANTRLAEMLGYDHPRALMDAVSDIGRDVFGDPQVMAEMAAGLKQGRHVDGAEVQWRRRDGAEIWVLLSIRGVREDDALPMFFEGSAVDVTARREARRNLIKAKEEAELANRAKSEFLAHMSHELRTPLNCIIGFSQILMEQMFGPLGHDNYREYVGDVHTAGHHLLNVISDILDISKIEAGELEIADEDVDVAATMVNCMKMMRERSDRGQIVLATELANHLPKIRADGLRIKQILFNLLSNAVKYTPPGGRVTALAFLADDGDLILQVRDTGIGISEDDMPRVLAPFEQIRDSYIVAGEGTGLGVHLTKVLTELHGGRFGIDSALGEGTTVTVTLPKARIIVDDDEEAEAGAAG